MEIRPTTGSVLSLGELEAQVVEILPDRAALSLVDGLASIPTPSSLGSLVSNAGTASGAADQTAPIVQGLSAPPAIPAL
jgi:hypothetical protein